MYNHILGPLLKVSESEKYKDDKQWFKDCMNFIKPYSTFGMADTKTIEKKIANYRLVNSDIRWEDFKELCDPLGINQEAFEESLVPFNIVSKVVNELIGEELKRNDDYRPVLVTQQALSYKDKEFENYLDVLLEEQIEKILSLSKIQDEKQLEQAKTQLFQELKEVSKFQSKKEILASKILDYGIYDNDIKRLKSDCWKDVIINDEEYVQVTVEKNKPVIKKINPLYMEYFKSSEEVYVQKGDWAGQIKPETYSEVITNYSELMTKDELESLVGGNVTKNSFHHSQQNRNSDVIWDNMTTITNQGVGSYTSSISPISFHRNFIWVTHLEWKAFRKIGYLSYTDEYGAQITEMVDETFEIPKNAIGEKEISQFGDETMVYKWYEDKFYQLEWLWLPRVYEGTRIGDNIFVNLRERPYQTTNIEDPYTTCTLSYCGRTYTSYNAKSISFVDKMKPFNILFIIAMNHLVKTIARNKGVLINIDTSQTDTELVQSKDPEEALEVRLKYMDLGYNIFNSSKIGDKEIAGMSRPAPSIDNADSTNVILNILNLLEWINKEIAMSIGVSPQRMAQMVSDRVSDNQQALIQSSYITEPYFFMHNETWKEIYLQYIRTFIIWLKDWKEKNPNKENYFLNYNFSKEEIATVVVDPEILEESDYGIRMLLGGNTREYYEAIKSLQMALIQNDQMSLTDLSELLLASVGGTSPYETNELLHKVEEKKKQREQQMNEMQMQMEQQKVAVQEKLLAQQIEMEKMRHGFKLEEIMVQGDINKEIAAIKVYDYAQDLDVDKDNVPDPLEAAKLQHQINKDNREEYYKDKDVEMKQKELDRKERELELAKESEKNEMIKFRKKKKD